MYDYLIGLSFEECVKKLEEKKVTYDFGEDVSYEDILNEIQTCKENDDYSFENVYIYIGGYWGDTHQEIWFDDDYKVSHIVKDSWE